MGGVGRIPHCDNCHSSLSLARDWSHFLLFLRSSSLRPPLVSRYMRRYSGGRRVSGCVARVVLIFAVFCHVPSLPPLPSSYSFCLLCHRWRGVSAWREGGGGVSCSRVWGSLFLAAVRNKVVTKSELEKIFLIAFIFIYNFPAWYKSKRM